LLTIHYHYRRETVFWYATQVISGRPQLCGGILDIRDARASPEIARGVYGLR
jgi:hypothetical protein